MRSFTWCVVSHHNNFCASFWGSSVNCPNTLHLIFKLQELRHIFFQRLQHPQVLLFHPKHLGKSISNTSSLARVVSNSLTVCHVKLSANHISIPSTICCWINTQIQLFWNYVTSLYADVMEDHACQGRHPSSFWGAFTLPH